MSEQQANQPEFTIQRIYTKDISFESPQSPGIFQKEWKPDLNLQIQNITNNLSPDVYEVILHLTITAQAENKTVFLAEIHQAGIFTLKNFNQEQLQAVLGAACPNVLFPYARELVSDLVNRGTFPPLYLAPVNFDALYMQQMQEQAGDGQSSIITN